MMKLNVRGEVADFQDASQFEPKKSEFAYSEFAGAVVKFAGYPGGGTTSMQEEINQVADAFYTKYIGPNVESDTQGTSIEVIHQIKGLWGTLPRYIEPTKQRYCSSWGVCIIEIEMDGEL